VAERILLVEDDAAIAEMVDDALLRHGFQCIRAADAAEASRVLGHTRPELILLDWMLPGISGLEFARRLRREDATRDIPVIMLTARCEEADTVAGFEAGVDDYVGKPFSVRELVARIRAVLRRSASLSEGDAITVGGLSLDPASHRVSANGETVRIGPTEFRMLKFFMEHQERVYTRSQLLDHVWGNNVYVEERTVDVHIRRLRKALAEAGFDRFVQTVHGTGYRFSRQD
jgi:two-component system phosphate regulon response regulator PhoB